MVTNVIVFHIKKVQLQIVKVEEGTEYLSKGVTITNTIVETDSRGFIWAKFDKNYFKIDDTIYMRFAYIPPSDSVYFKAHERDFFEQLEAHIMKYSTLGKVSIFW